MSGDVAGGLSAARPSRRLFLWLPLRLPWSGLRPWLAGLALAGLAIGVWQAASEARLAPPYMLPSPATVALRLHMELTGGTFRQDVSATLARALEGFALGSVAGLAAGLVLGLSRVADRLLGPTLLAYRQIALFAWVPLLSLWFGGGETGKAAFVTVAAFTPMTMNTWRSARAVPAPLRELAAVLMFGRLDAIRLIILPGALPGILAGVRNALIHAWLAAIGAELFLDIAPGLGGRLNEGRDKFEVDLILAILMVLSTLGLAFSQLAAAGERWLLRWRAR